MQGRDNSEFGKYKVNVNEDVTVDNRILLYDKAKGDYKLYSLEHSNIPWLF
jgi:hypothetical protein